MQYNAGPYRVAANAPVDERGAFIFNTYLHLIGAVFAFVLIETALFASGLAWPLAEMMMASRFGWLLTMGLFIGAGYVARNWARNNTTAPMQYAGLGLYVVVEAIVFVPLLAIASYYAPGAITSAGITTVILFGGLTGVVFLTRKDFSFMRGFLGVASLVALGVIVCSLLFGFSLGVFFSGAMCLLAGGYILYYTSEILHNYPTDRHVGAALELFSAVALLFWYVLRIFMSSRR